MRNVHQWRTRLSIAGLCAVGALFSTVSSQDFEFIIRDTLWVKVTFYDFHQNSNFGEGNCGTATGMVQDTLDADRKPVLNKDRCSNDLLAQWYRPSGTVNAAFQPFLGTWSNLVNYKGKSDELVGTGFNAADPMANIVIYDSLPFSLVDSSTGTYSFVQTNKAPGGGFFWLDGRGFGEEPAGSGHNFYFTMELHKEFVYKGGEQFSFRGDDDVWVFINGKLALDLGGMQAETKRDLILDDVADELGIVKGQTYPMDFFYTERRHPQSNCEITTNLLTPVRPRELIVTTSPETPDPRTDRGLMDTTMQIGATIPLYIYVFDDNNNLRTEMLDGVVWRFQDRNGNLLRPDTAGRMVRFTMPDIGGCVYLIQAFDDTTDEFPVVENYIRICPDGRIDTTTNPPDTTTNPPDTTTNPPDTTTNPPDTTVNPPDTTTNPPDTTVDPPDTTTNPPDTTVNPPDTVSQTDLFGAIIKEVIFYPGTGRVTNVVDPLYDTLRIELTEPIDRTTISVGAVKDIFILSDNGTFTSDALRDASLELDTSVTMVTSIIMLVPYNSIVITPGKDSLVFVEETPYVVDDKGDVPPPDMKPVVIKWGNAGVVAGAMPNPGSPTVAISSEIRDHFVRNFTEVRQTGGNTNAGTIVGVETLVPLVRLKDSEVPSGARGGDVFGLADVYDAVGNLVAKDLPVKESNTYRGVYGVHWNMRNRANRVVGKGAYLMMIKVQYENSKIKSIVKVKILR